MYFLQKQNKYQDSEVQTNFSCLIFKSMCFEILAHLLRDKSATVDLRWGLTFKGNNFASRVHDGAVGRDGATDGVVGISQINDDNLSLFTNLLSYTDELVRLHCKRAKSNVGWVDPQVLELAMKRRPVLMAAIGTQYNIEDKISFGRIFP